jgi:hypothetical protein
MEEKMVMTKPKYKKEGDLREMSEVTLFGYLLIRIFTDGESFFLKAKVIEDGSEKPTILDIVSVLSFTIDMESRGIHGGFGFHNLVSDSQRRYTVKILQLDRNPLLTLNFSDVDEFINGIINNNIQDGASPVSVSGNFDIQKLVKFREDFNLIESVESFDGFLVISLKKKYCPEFIEIKG